jgi:hypothetical protein
LWTDAYKSSLAGSDDLAAAKAPGLKGLWRADMRNRLTFPRSTVAIAGGLLAVLAVVGTAQAITETAFKYSAPKNGFFTIDHTAMKPLAPGSNYISSFDTSLRLLADGGPCFAAGVHLPNGAKITGVAVTYRSGVGEDPGGLLFSRKFSDGTATAIAAKEIVDDSDVRKVAHLGMLATPSQATVNNAQYSYTFGFCLETTDNFFDMARIAYTYQNAGD